jgi:hypothetical protein
MVSAEEVRPPQLAASFISGQTCDVAHWHIASFASFGAVQRQVRSWGKVGSGWPTVNVKRLP